MFFHLLKREIKTYYLKKGELAELLAFFYLAIFLLPFALGSEPEILKSIGLQYFWIIELFVILFSLKFFFTDDYNDGSLEQIFLAYPIYYITIIKALAYCLVIILISSLALPFLGILYFLELKTVASLFFSVLLGVPCLGLIGIFGSALILGNRKASLVLPVIVMPLYIPVLIFAGSFSFSLLAALLLLLLPLCIFFSSILLTIAIKE